MVTEQGDTGRVVAVAITHEVHDDDHNAVGRTGIDKRPVQGPVQVGELGLAGDVQIDTAHHGGVDKAVYAYDEAAQQWWVTELARPLTPGSFGENLLLAGIDVDGSRVGERWAIGATLVVEVAQPRIPCATFADHLGEKGWVKRFLEAGRPGAYLRLVVPGPVAAGDTVTVVHRPQHDVALRDLLPPVDPGAAQALLAAASTEGLDLPVSLRRSLGRANR